jgi:hypothetical protein
MDLFPLMRRAGFYGFLIGFESGDDEALSRWNKGTTANKAREIAPHLTSTFESITGTFFIGDWESGEEDFIRTRQFAEDLGVDIFIESTLTLFPPTIPIWKQYEDRGITMEWDYDAIGNCKVILPTGSLSQERVFQLQGQNMSSFYTDPKKAIHALRSGKHAARAFTSILFSGLEDLGRSKLRAIVPDEWRGDMRMLRVEYKRRHLAYASERGWMPMQRPWVDPAAAR